ncbi:MAG: SDR family oxidoreductase [Solirubrobacterales bacterium]
MDEARRSETVLVTGGSGFLGGWCVIELLRRGYDVRATIRDPSKESEIRSRFEPEVDPGDRLTVLAADLTRDDGWQEAVAGCDYVLHVASPFPPSQPKDPDELIVPAREGTLRVLGAALDAGAKRVVVTSSVAALRNPADPPDGPITEECWTDLHNPDLNAYPRSKTIAEMAAWELVRERAEEDRLAVVNPGAILGPVIANDLSYSLEVIERMLKGMPGVPKLGFNFVDVRDVADLEIRAMTDPKAGGERFIAADRWLWMGEVAAILRERLGERAAKAPTRTVPSFVVRGMALVDGGLRSIVGDLGKRVDVTSEKARSTLGWTPMPIEDSIADTAEALIRHGAAPEPAAAQAP